MPLVTHEAVDPVGGEGAQIVAVEVELVASTAAPRVFRRSDGTEVRPREMYPLTPGPTGYPATWSLQLASQASLEPGDTVYVIRQHFVTDQGITVTEDRAQVPDGAGPYKLRDCLTLNPGTPGIVVGWTPAGWWDTEVLYRMREVVGHAGQSYVARRDNAGIEPGTDTSVWQLVGTVQPSSLPAPATSSTFGGIKLGGDVAGPASAPTVPRLLEKLGPIVDVTAYGAVGDATTDNADAIDAAVADCPPGGIVWFPITDSGGVYGTSRRHDTPANITVRGQHGSTLVYAGAEAPPVTIRPLAGFPAGQSVFRLRGKSLTGAALDHVGTRFENLTILGTALPAGSDVDAFRLQGLVREATFENVSVIRVTGTGFDVGDPTGPAPMSLRFRNCVTHDVGGAGFALSNCPDTSLWDCNAQGSGWIGFYLAGMPNGFAFGCRAEWSGQQGFYITSGLWGTGQGSGGFALIGCLTDRNGRDGVLIDATGNAPISLVGCTHRRDGRDGGTTYAGVRAAATTMPVTITAIETYPGVNDDGAGTLSPYAAVSATGSTSVVVASGDLHAATTPVVDGGGNGAFVVSPMCSRATGPSGSPTRTAPVGVVPVTQRAPLGGVQTITYAAAITPNAATSTQGRCVPTGAMTVNAPSGGVDGELYLLTLAPAADRTITIDAAIEVFVDQSRTITATGGKKTRLGFHRDNGTWTLTAVGVTA